MGKEIINFISFSTKNTSIVEVFFGFYPILCYISYVINNKFMKKEKKLLNKELEECDECCECGEFCENKHFNHATSGDMVYILGFIGAVIYFISQASTFWIGVLGFLKAIIWPVFVVYELLKYFHL